MVAVRKEDFRTKFVGRNVSALISGKERFSANLMLKNFVMDKVMVVVVMEVRR
jgi:hypothetical protein